MTRFVVYTNPEGEGYLLDVQADLLDHLNTRVVVPLLPIAAAPAPANTLNPVFQIEGEKVVMVTQFMAAIPAPILKLPVHNLADSRNDITAALDLLFQGF
jgi:toxin CcdB